VLHAHEVVVPAAGVGRHVKAHEPVRQQQLDLLVVVGGEVARVGGGVAVGAAPLVAAGGELVCGKGAGAGGEAAGDADATLAVPGPGGWGGRWVGGGLVEGCGEDGGWERKMVGRWWTDKTYKEAEGWRQLAIEAIPAHC